MSNEEMLLKLKREVLEGEPGSALPSRLSDEWLDRAIDSVEGMLYGEGDKRLNDIGMALVIKTLSDKHEKHSMSVPMEDMFEYMQVYMLELALEEVSRKTDISASSATLETIFEKNRKVEIARCMDALPE